MRSALPVRCGMAGGLTPAFYLQPINHPRKLSETAVSDRRQNRPKTARHSRGGILSRQCRTKSHTAHSRATRGELLFGLRCAVYGPARFTYLLLCCQFDVLSDVLRHDLGIYLLHLLVEFRRKCRVLLLEVHLYRRQFFLGYLYCY